MRSIILAGRRPRSRLLSQLSGMCGLLALGINIGFTVPVSATPAMYWQPWLDPAGIGSPPGAGSSARGLKSVDTDQFTQDIAHVQSRLTRKLVTLADDGSHRLQSERLARRAAPPSLQAVVLMCDFADSLLYGRWGQVPGDFPPPRQSEFYYAAHDSVYFNHLWTDVATYFDIVSDGQFTLNFDVEATVANLSEPMGFYGNHPDEGEQPFQLAHDVISQLDPEIDFSLYDTVILIHAGAGEETDISDNSPEQIFSTYLSPEDFEEAVADSLLENPYIPSDDFPPGQGVDQVLILPETEYQDPIGGFGGYFGSLGVYCFEVGLRLGMLSLSDFTPAGRPDSQGIGEFGLMGFGLFVGAGFIPDHPCAFNKMLMGWLEPYPVQAEQDRSHFLVPANRATDPLATARVEINGQEYWLVEYRLQDPDGNGIFSWDDDLNGNGIPDFYDADSVFGDGTPSGFFDPATDQREWLTGAEFDFFMSENSARPPGVKGAGSGLYIWHVDEGVIQDVFGAERNLFNANPQRKSVDLEEADGIQDLDSRVGSPYLLGSDDDSFRGEDNATFGPDTLPGSESAGDAWTGTIMDQISNVVVDSTGGGSGMITYADTMTFHCWRVRDTSNRPELKAERLLEGVDLRGSHLLAVDLDAPPDGIWEIVAVSQTGEIFAFEPDLSEHVDHDGNDTTIEPLVVGTDTTGAPVTWNGPAAAGDIDDDDLTELLLTAAGGLYAFNGEDGSEVSGDGDDRERGLLVALLNCRLPPVLLPWNEGATYSPTEPVIICVVDSVASGSVLKFLTGDGQSAYTDLALGDVTVPSPPLLVDGILFVATSTGEVGGHSLIMIPWSPRLTAPEIVTSISLSVQPGPLSLAGTVQVYGQAPGEESPFLIIPGKAGRGEVVRWRGTEFLSQTLWPGDMPLLSSPAPSLLGVENSGFFEQNRRKSSQVAGVAVTLPSMFSVAAANGFPLNGWPRQPLPPVAATEESWAPSPVRNKTEVIFTSRDGRLYLYDAQGNLKPGWPLAGPAATAGTPLLLDLDGDAEFELTACGTFERITGIDSEVDALQTLPIAKLAVWNGITTDLVTSVTRLEGWNMWRGSPWRNMGRSVTQGERKPGGFLVDGSHICYPNPLTASPLHVRAEATQNGQARVFIYNLEGEQVATAGPQVVFGGEPFELVLPFENFAGGMYLCRLVLECDCGGAQTSVITFGAAK